MPNREIKVMWYDDPAEAEQDLARDHATMTPDERVKETVDLMVWVAGWEPHGRLTRTARLVDIP